MRRIACRPTALLHHTPNEHRQQQQQQHRGDSDEPAHPRRAPRSNLLCHTSFSKNLLHFPAQLRWRGVPGRALSYRIKKVELSREQSSARFAVREMRLDHSTFFTLQLIIEIQGQTATYVLTLLQSSDWSLSSQTTFARDLVCQVESSFLSFPRARPSRDITVPAGQSSTVAIS